MKFEQKLKIIVLILIIVLVSLMSFGGLFIQNNGKMVNLLPNYIKGMDLKGYRYITLEVAEDEEHNHDNEEEKVEESAQTAEQQTEVDAKKDFINAKKIIEKRLKEMNVAQYTVAQDEQTGRIIINMVEDTATDTVIQYLYATGNLTIEDPDGNVLLDSSQIKQVKTMYANTNNGTSIYLNIEFNKEGKEILRNISNEYRIPENTEEDTEEKATENVEENTEESKEVTIKIDGAKVLSTQFEKEITNGSIQLSVGGATTSQAELQTYAKEAGYVEKILNNGALPVEYEVTANRYVKSNITADTYSIGIIVLTVIVLGAMIYLINYTIEELVELYKVIELKENTLKNELKKLDGTKDLKIGIIIGPEGGMDKTEVEKLAKAGAKVVTLGKRILRTETASISIMSNIVYEFEL